MNILIPQPGMDKDWKGWAAKLTVALVQAFQRVPEPIPGTMVLWPSTLTIPPEYLKADGTEYPTSISTALAKLFGESSPGNFEVPTITAPTGSFVIIKK